MSLAARLFDLVFEFVPMDWRSDAAGARGASVWLQLALASRGHARRVLDRWTLVRPTLPRAIDGVAHYGMRSLMLARGSEEDIARALRPMRRRQDTWRATLRANPCAACGAVRGTVRRFWLGAWWAPLCGACYGGDQPAFRFVYNAEVRRGMHTGLDPRQSQKLYRFLAARVPPHNKGGVRRMYALRTVRKYARMLRRSGRLVRDETEDSPDPWRSIGP